MDLTLKYAGKLVSAHSDNATRAKHELRRHFHIQLATLWSEHPLLKDTDPTTLQMAFRKSGRYEIERPIGSSGLLWRFPLGGYDIVPLVSHVHEVHCHLAMRIYRCRERGSIVYSGGDLDNQLKVLFDSLSMPKDETYSDRQNSSGAVTNETFFCLLEDDQLITKLSVESFVLLDPSKKDHRNYVEADIEVHVEPVTPMIANLDLLFP